MEKMKRVLKSIYRYSRKRIFGEGVVNFRGEGIVNFIDVGSAGDLPHPWEKNANRIRHLLKFEPRDKRSISPNVVSLDVALWETNCERDFYIYKGRGGSGSSLFQQNYEYVAENFEELRSRGPEYLASSWFERSKLHRTERITCRTLDGVIQELHHPFPYHFLKIDAQGAEYEVLRGADAFLRESCVGIHLELFMLPLYKGIKLLPEVKQYLENLEFDLIKEFPAQGSFDAQHDCLFLKRGQNSKVVDVIREIYAL